MKTTIVVNKNGMGEAHPDLSKTLITNYFGLLTEEKELPAYICFYADGVKLCTGDSPILESIKTLETMGVKILICKTCINFYGIADQVAAGTIGTMMDIMGAQMHCDKVIVL